MPYPLTTGVLSSTNATVDFKTPVSGRKRPYGAFCLQIAREPGGIHTHTLSLSLSLSAASGDSSKESGDAGRFPVRVDYGSIIFACSGISVTEILSASFGLLQVWKCWWKKK